MAIFLHGVGDHLQPFQCKANTTVQFHFNPLTKNNKNESNRIKYYQIKV